LTGYPVGDANKFCNKGINVYNFSNSPTAFTYYSVNPAATHGETYCTFPTPTYNSSVSCDTVYTYPPTQRFCSCVSTLCTTNLPTTIPTVSPTVIPTSKSKIIPTNYNASNIGTKAPTLVFIKSAFNQKRKNKLQITKSKPRATSLTGPSIKRKEIYLNEPSKHKFTNEPTEENLGLKTPSSSPSISSLPIYILIVEHFNGTYLV
jgi:hypothetical protein